MHRVDMDLQATYQGRPCRVAVLDGGFPAWQAKGYPVDSEAVSDADVDAGAHAARQSKSSQARYPAKLQVGAWECTCTKHTSAARVTPSQVRAVWYFACPLSIMLSWRPITVHAIS